MEKLEQVKRILKALDWDSAFVLKTARSNSPAITAEQFVSALVDNTTVVATSKALNCGQQTLNRLIDRHLVPQFGKLNGGGETWLYKLRTFAKMRKCTSCQHILDHSEFGKDASKSDGLYSECKKCRAKNNEMWYSKNADYHKEYFQDNKASFIANNAKRRAAKIQATPSWANMSLIKDIYINCPTGYHVDHIYPLQSDWVCGLHTIDNLQILPEKENLSKGNRYIPEIHG